MGNACTFVYSTFSSRLMPMIKHVSPRTSVVSTDSRSIHQWLIKKLLKKRFVALFIALVPLPSGSVQQRIKFLNGVPLKIVCLLIGLASDVTPLSRPDI